MDYLSKVIGIQIGFMILTYHILSNALLISKWHYLDTKDAGQCHLKFMINIVFEIIV